MEPIPSPDGQLQDIQQRWKCAGDKLQLLFEVHSAAWIAISKDLGLVFKQRRVKRMEEERQISNLIRRLEIPNALVSARVDAGRARKSLGVGGELRVQLYQSFRTVRDIQENRLLTKNFSRLLDLDSLFAMETIADLGPLDLHGKNIGFQEVPGRFPTLRLCFFDWDYFLTESNRVRLREEATIPFRSHWLGMSASSEPYSDELLDRIVAHRSRYDRARRWIYRWNAPCRAQLNDSEQKELDGMLRADWFDLDNNLSAARKKGDWRTHAEARSGFRVTNGKVRSWLHSKGVDVSKGNWVKVQKQLFPRLTGRQALALEQRWERRDQYLDNFKTLDRLRTFGAFKTFFKGPNPLSSVEFNKYRVIRRSGSISKVDLDWLINRCRPNYRNTSCVKIPFLSNVLRLFPIFAEKELIPNGAHPAAYIGTSKFSLERLLKVVDKRRDQFSEEANALADALADRIESAIKRKDFTVT